jgi:hypothetical protein
MAVKNTKKKREKSGNPNCLFRAYPFLEQIVLVKRRKGGKMYT